VACWTLDAPTILDRVSRGDVASRFALQSALGDSARDSDAQAELLDPLARLAASGDANGLDVLIWAVDSLALAHRSIARLVLDETDADDVAQEVLRQRGLLGGV